MISSYPTITQSYAIAVGTHNAFTAMPLHRQLPWSVEADNRCGPSRIDVLGFQADISVSDCIIPMLDIPVHSASTQFWVYIMNRTTYLIKNFTLDIPR